MALPIIIGEFRSGGDAELRFIPSGAAVATFSIIANSAKKLDNGEWETTAETPWLRVNAWRKMAERAAEEVTKGCRIQIVGRLKARKWTDNDGNDRESIEVDLDAFEVIPPRESQQSSGQSKPQGQSKDWQGGDPWAAAPGGTDEPPF